MDDWGFNQWFFTFIMTGMMGLVAYFYRDLRKELHQLSKLMQSFSDYVIAARTDDGNWDGWRAGIEQRLNNHSDRMNTHNEIATVNREKLTSLEKWRDRLERNERRGGTE